ncbi:hypothetical protein FRC09_019644 [Ceratobasidium sp. 395]|nr:hypothetical protein FRC09_019644 [Ceratobasidium sp. 395]
MKRYPASPRGKRRPSCRSNLFPRLLSDRAPGPLPNGASASFSYRGLLQTPVPGAASPVSPPPDGMPLVFDRERPAPPAPEFEYAGGPLQQALLANISRAEARIASLSAQSNPSAVFAQSEARAEAAEARLTAIKDGWRGVENYLDMLLRREAEARAAFVRTLGTGEVGVPPSVPVFGAGPTGPYLPCPPSHPAPALAPRVPQHARQVLLAESCETGVRLESLANQAQEHAPTQAWPQPPRL